MPSFGKIGDGMANQRIHITGASGSGVTTLGRALATALAVPHHDTDDYYWLPTEPPFTDKRPIEDRLRLMEEMFLPRMAWVLSGSLAGWGDPLIAHFDAVAFVRTPTDVRLARLRAREALRYGDAAIAPGGARHEHTETFAAWAAQYDTAGLEMRSLRRHETWLDTLLCPVIRVDGTAPIAETVDRVLSSLET